MRYGMKKSAVFISGIVILTLISVVSLVSGSGKQLVKWVHATSTLKDKNNRYDAGNLLDGSSGSWCEGAKGDGIGEKVSLEFRREVNLRSLSIINGLKSGKYYGMNNRVKEIRINGESHILKDSPREQTIIFNKTLRVKKLVLEIGSVYPGSKWKDTCLTEIGINGPAKVTGDYGDDLMGSIAGTGWRPPDGLFNEYGTTIMIFNRALMFSEEEVPCGDESCPMTYSGYCKRVSEGVYRCAYTDYCYGMMTGKMPEVKVVRVCKGDKRTFLLRIIKGKPEVEFKGKRKILVRD